MSGVITVSLRVRHDSTNDKQYLIKIWPLHTEARACLEHVLGLKHDSVFLFYLHKAKAEADTDRRLASELLLTLGITFLFQVNE